MMKKIIPILLLTASFTFSQEFEIEQLTDIEAGIRNPVFPHYEYNMPGFYYGQGFEGSQIYFEVLTTNENDTSINIAYIDFNYDDRKFDDQIHFLTDENYVRRNITSTTFPKYMVMWETNRYESWDIEYTIMGHDSTWSEPKILIGSEKDELNVRFTHMVATYHENGYENTTWFTFEKDHKIYLAEFSDSLINVELVFQDTLNYRYAHPTSSIGGSWYDDKKLFVSAEAIAAEDSQKKIVLTDKYIGSEEWKDLKIISDSGNSHSPRFLQLGYSGSYILSFEIEDNNRNSVYLLLGNDHNYDPYDSGLSELLEDTTVSTSEFSSFIYFIVTRQLSISDVTTYFPYIYKAIKNDTTFWVMSPGYEHYFDQGKWVEVKLNSTNATIGPVAPYPEAMLSYMVWTDSTKNGINLFGIKRYDGLGSVDDEEGLKNNITLSQNYPNPFNPTTKIKFAIPTSPSPSPYQGEGDRVRLVVYDILGREVTTLLNKPLQPGVYEVEFDGSDLPSGVYLYRCSVGEFSQSKKMLLIK